MPLSPEAQKIIGDEKLVLKTVIDSLENQASVGKRRFSIESDRARDLNSQIVALRRAEEKALLASDEAVAYSLTQKKVEELKTIERQLKKPYFARIVLDEDETNGTRQIEYRLGFAANPDCRIIDWRRAPIAKLYYEYREGDEYSEEILGKERAGKIKLRNVVDIQNQQLNSISCGLGKFEIVNGDWIQSQSVNHSRGTSTSGELPHILSLITPEQFHLITEDAHTAILIQGVAGSGKTTVALHRLAWLLHEDNSEIKPEECVVLVMSKALKAYTSKVLPSMGIEGVRVLTFNEWCAETILKIAPHLGNGQGQIVRPNERPGLGIERARKSMALLKAAEEYAASRGPVPDLEEAVINILSRHDLIIKYDESGLLDREVISRALARAKENRELKRLDYCDDALLMRLARLRMNGVQLKSGEVGLYRHIVLDEVQDFSPLEIAAVVGAVKEVKELTLVGDTSQKIDSSSTFSGWDTLRSHWQFKDGVSKFVTLSVSFRSTLPIMKLADYVQNRPSINQGRPGRVPLWFKCNNEKRGIESIISWLGKAQELYPGALSAVICHDSAEARYVLSLLEPSFGSAARIGDDFTFSFEQGIVVTDLNHVKGLEFTNVVLWNPSRKFYSKDIESRNRLYVCITRAEENLCIVTWGKPPDILPPNNSPLVRAMDVGNEEPQ